MQQKKINVARAITHPLGITIIYIVIGFLWIFYSDFLVNEVLGQDPDALREIQTFKGTIFVLLSGGLIYAFTKTLDFSLKQKISEHRAAKERLNEAQKIGKLGDWSYDVATGQMTWSNEVYNIYEIDPKLPPPTRAEVRKFYTEYDAKRMNQVVEAAIKEGESYDLDTKIIVNGKEKYVRNLGIPVRKNDQTIELKGIVQDITDRKIAEIEKEQLTNRLNTIADNLPGAIFQYVLKADGSDELQYLSEGAINLWGVRPEEGMMNNDLIWSQIHEKDLPVVLNSIQKSGDKLEQWHAIWRSNHPTNGLRWHEGIGQPKLKDDGSIVWNSIILDITEQKRAEIEKTKLGERLNALADNLPGIIFQYKINSDNTDEVEYLSAGSEEIFGLTAEEIMADINKAWDRFHPDDVPVINEKIARSAETMQPFMSEWRVMHPTKGVIWQQGFGTPKRNSNGSIIWDTIVLDISDRKKAEQELLESKILLEKTINNIKEAVFLIDPEHREIVLANNAVEQIFGYKPEELLGQQTSILYPSAEKFEEFAKIGEPKLDMDGVFHTAFQMKHKNGQVIETENTVTPISETEGYKGGVVSVVRDVTKKKESERRLKEREEYLSILMANASDAILACDDKGNIKFYNETLEKWVDKVDTSLPVEKWPEKYKWFDMNTNQPLEKENISLICALTKGKVRNHQFIIKRNSDKRFIEANGAALYADDNQKIGAMVVMRDVTDRMNRDIEISNAILDAIDEERMDIASEIHDSLTQTLSIVSQNIKNLILSDTALGDNTKLKKAQQFLQNAIDESRSLSHRIMPKSIEDFGLVVAIEELTENLQKVHAIDFKLNYNKEFRLKKDIEINIFRILQEALNNIVKHAKASVVEIELNQTDDILEVEIADDGVGISSKSRGKGIGLSTMKNRALKLNAGFDIKSDDTGTTITLKVPLQ